MHVAALRRKCRTACGTAAGGLTITAVRGEGYLLAAGTPTASYENSVTSRLLSARKLVTNTIDTIDISLSRMLIDGPEVSL